MCDGSPNHPYQNSSAFLLHQQRSELADSLIRFLPAKVNNHQSPPPRIVIAIQPHSQTTVAGNHDVEVAAHIKIAVTALAFRRKQVAANQLFQYRRTFPHQELGWNILACENRLPQKTKQLESLAEKFRAKLGHVFCADYIFHDLRERGLPAAGCASKKHDPLRRIPSEQQRATPTLEEGNVVCIQSRSQ